MKMKMKMIIIIIVTVLLATLSMLSSCKRDISNNITPSTSPEMQESHYPSELSSTTPSINTPTNTETVGYPVYLPPPEYNVFSEITNEQEHLDAFLHHIALTSFNTYPTSLVIPSLRLIETWEAEDGDNYYLCWSAQIYYPDLAKAISLGDSYEKTDWDYNIRLIRFKVKNTLDWGYLEFMFPHYQCVEILYTPDGEGGDSSPDNLAGFPGSQDQMQRIRECDQDYYIRDILPAEMARDYYALLEAYLEYYDFALPVIR